MFHNVACVPKNDLQVKPRKNTVIKVAPLIMTQSWPGLQELEILVHVFSCT